MIAALRSLRRGVLFSQSCTHHRTPNPHSSRLVRPRTASQLAHKKPPSVAVPYTSPSLLSLWAQRMRTQPTFLFHSAASLVQIYKRQLNDGALLLNLGRSLRDPAAIRAAYPIYIKAARLLIPELVRQGDKTPFHHIESCMSYLGPSMDILSSSGHPEDKDMLETILEDFDSFWWTAYQFHVDISSDVHNGNEWQRPISQLVRFGRREKAIQVLLRIETIREARKHSQQKGVLNSNMRPCWRVVTRSYLEEHDFQGIQTLLETISSGPSKSISFATQAEVLIWLCDHPDAPQVYLDRYARALFEHQSQLTNTQRAVLLRVCIRLGWWDVADRQARHLLYMVDDKGFQSPGKTNSLPWDTLVLYAIRRHDLSSAWTNLKRMTQCGHIVRPGTLQALVKLDREHEADLGALKQLRLADGAPLDQQRSQDDELLDSDAFLLDDHADKVKVRRKAALKVIYRALVKNEDNTNRAIDVYDRARTQGLAPHVDLLLPIVARLCSKKELEKGGFDIAMTLFKELAAAHPPPEVAHQSHTEHGPQKEGGPSSSLVTLLLESLITKPDLEHARALFSERSKRELLVRDGLANEVLESCISQARDHAQGFEYMKIGIDSFKGSFLRVDLWRYWLETTYPESNSIVPSADLVLAALPFVGADNNLDFDLSSRVYSALRRYHLLARHIWVTHGTTELGKKLLGQVHRSVKTFHKMINTSHLPQSPLYHSSFRTPYQVSIAYSYLMNCYNELGQPEVSLKIFDMLWQKRLIETYILFHTFRACQLLGEWRLAIGVWTRVQIAIENNEFQSLLTPRMTKFMFDQFCAALAPANMVLRSAADTVQQNIVNGRAFTQRSRFLKMDQETALYVLKLVDEVVPDRGREILEKSFKDHLTTVFISLLQHRLLKYWTIHEGKAEPVFVRPPEVVREPQRKQLASRPSTQDAPFTPGSDSTSDQQHTWTEQSAAIEEIREKKPQMRGWEKFLGPYKSEEGIGSGDTGQSETAPSAHTPESNLDTASAEASSHIAEEGNGKGRFEDDVEEAVDDPVNLAVPMLRPVAESEASVEFHWKPKETNLDEQEGTPRTLGRKKRTIGEIARALEVL
ncbi:hypothetical protein DACRYDRAFT_117022 [Dacryopinax primogenitus]|uniref:Uncharacterized protein n=1 Tax=Dacryopinax primogenitus (strain DJM 731) TaxID=1858805 RepID=M5G9M8_DACPD|nr:uncharacterized protein DACRYDRAFT_117022 [Dacryopinax primogenitus]EJU00523.1 hypothetical protein DACRYDRAFT_117022 [Dacryopinax primogenitus]